MADTSVSVFDSGNVARAIDSQSLPNGALQQTLNIGDGVTNGRFANVDSGQRLWVRSAPAASTTGTVTSVTSTTSSTTLLALNVNRLEASLFNESTATLYLAMAATASLTAYTIQIPPGSYFEMPGRVIYTGPITGIWSTANGFARLTEYT